jgi:hypothetical protein
MRYGTAILIAAVMASIVIVPHSLADPVLRGGPGGSLKNCFGFGTDADKVEHDGELPRLVQPPKHVPNHEGSGLRMTTVEQQWKEVAYYRLFAVDQTTNRHTYILTGWTQDPDIDCVLASIPCQELADEVRKWLDETEAALSQQNIAAVRPPPAEAGLTCPNV